MGYYEDVVNKVDEENYGDDVADISTIARRQMMTRTTIASTSGNIGPVLRARRKWVYNVPRRTGHFEEKDDVSIIKDYS